MYDFLFSEEFWMETIIAAVITAVVTLGVAALYYNYKIKTIFENSKELLRTQIDTSAGNTREHNNLSKEHNEILKEMSFVNSDVKRTESGIQSIIKDLTEEKTAQNYRYENLTEKQKNIVNSIDNIKAMSDELKRLAGENADLRQELYRERERNQEMINRLDRKPRARGHER
ncbi:MAG: hypothetical protein PHE79_07910 [Eubacteriales bacterium]|nr:hypothetical protein [Eubacteriales bacterium]